MDRIQVPTLAEVSPSRRNELKSFGNRVRAIRESAGWSQEDLAEKADLHRTYISDIERGVRNVSLLNIDAIAKALDLKQSDLFRLLEKE